MSCQLTAVPPGIKCSDLPMPEDAPITVRDGIVYWGAAAIGEVIRWDENFIVFRHVTSNRYLNGKEQVLQIIVQRASAHYTPLGGRRAQGAG